MRALLKSGRRWLHGGWLLPVVLLALPHCALDSSGTIGGEDPPGLAFDPGPAPQMEAVMCDIPKVPNPATECATVAEAASLRSLAFAAIGLAEGEQHSIVLDYSPSAISACSGMPKKVEFYGPFPDGTHVCLNCPAQLGGSPPKYANPKAVCMAKCIDLVKQDGKEPEGYEDVWEYCEDKATVSTNVDHYCYTEACTNGGLPNMPFNDPRRIQESVKWIDLEGTAALGTATAGLGNSLTKPAGGPDTGEFDSSGQSEHLITHGDAWVEFGATENGVSHVLGVSTDTGLGSDLQLTDLAFALSLNYDGNNVYVLENGVPVPATPVGTYMPGERFRIEIKDNNNGTASISYVKLNGACMVGQPCPKTPLPVSPKTAAYPLRVSAMFREPGATLENVTMVRIQGQLWP